MPRYALRIEYDGRRFSGWQRQSARPSVQSAVEDALGRLERGPHAIAAAGRTDAGVHARGQVAHCDLARDWEPFRLSEALNHHLRPAPIAIRSCARAPGDWHARFSATERRYLFRVLMRRAPATLEAGQVWRVPHPLDLAAMRAGAVPLLGRHDFTTFRAARCQANSPVRTLDALEIEAVDGGAGPEIWFAFARGPSCTTRCAASWARWSVSARAPGRRTMCAPRWPRAIAPLAGRSVRPAGLYLAGVRYPEIPSPESPRAAIAGNAPAVARFATTKPQWRST